MKGKIAFIPRPRTIEFYQYEVPDPEPEGLIAEVTQTNVCGSEVHMWKGEIGGGAGVMPGHEMSGRIVALGDRVTTDWAGVPVHIGERIAPVSYIVCNRCVNCVNGNQAACLNNVVRQTHPDQPPHFTATFATHYCIAAGQHFYRIPDNVPDLVASSANCAMSIVFWVLDKGGLGFGETLLVMGAGGLGLHATALAKARGARVLAMDSVDRRLEQARQFGADEIIDLREYPDARSRRKRVRELTNYGPDVVLEVAGVPEGLRRRVVLCPAGWPRARSRQRTARAEYPNSARVHHHEIAPDNHRDGLPAALFKEITRFPEREYRSLSLPRTVRREICALAGGAGVGSQRAARSNPRRNPAARQLDKIVL